MSGDAFGWATLATSAVFGVVWVIGLIYIIRNTRPDKARRGDR